MTSKDFIQKYLAWLRVNGITATPDIAPSQFDQIPGAPNLTPSTLIVWHNLRGTRMTQSDSYMNNVNGNDDAVMKQYFSEVVQFTSGTAPTPEKFVNWNAFLKPPAPGAPPVGPIGPEIPQTNVVAMAAFGRIDPTKRYFQVMIGITDEFVLAFVDGKEYVSVKPSGPFTVWWMLK